MTHRWSAGGLSERHGATFKQEEAEGRRRARTISQQQAEDKLEAVRLIRQRDAIADRHAQTTSQARLDRAVGHLTFTESEGVKVAWFAFQEAEADATAAKEALEEHESNRPSEASKVKTWAAEKVRFGAELLAFVGIRDDKQAAYEQAQGLLTRAKQRAFDGLVAGLSNEIEADLRAANVELAELAKQLRQRREQLDQAIKAKAEKYWSLTGKPYQPRRTDRRPQLDLQAVDVMMQKQQEEHHARQTNV